MSFVHLSIVSQSKNPCLVGLSGIVVHETENAFKVVTRGNDLKRASTSSLHELSHLLIVCIYLVLPKQNAIFKFSVPLYSTLPPNHTVNTPFEIVSPDADNTAQPSSQALETVLDVPHIEFELYGNQFRFRAAERAGRKFKHKETIEL
jgi:ribonuclease P protein subunit POP4